MFIPLLSSFSFLFSRSLTYIKCVNFGLFCLGTSLIKQTSIPNMVKTLTTVAKFIVDVTAMDLAPNYQERCLKFTTDNLKFIITNLRECSLAQLQFTEEDLKDIFICLKSSFTYGAKLLNIVLKTCEDSLPQPETHSLVNALFNLIVSVEEFLGYRCAVRFIVVVQTWIPDLILALGSSCLLKQTPEKGFCCDTSDNATFGLPSWIYILAKVELCELRETRETGSDEEIDRVWHSKDFSAFKKLIETMTELLKSNSKILDAVGVIFLTCSLNAIGSKKFDIVLGLVHFVCVKLVRAEDGEWRELKLMLASLGEIYSKVEIEAEELCNSEDDRQKLYSAKALLEPVWTSFIYEERMHSMEAD